MKNCIFCQIAAGTLDSSTVFEDDEFVAFMDVYPWRPGHVLVIPRAHAGSIAELADGVAERLFGLATRIAAAIRASGDIPCDDLHLLINDGPAANQTVPHLHLHILPRRRGDLWKLGLALARRPIVTLLGQTPRAVLERQAAAIRAALSDR